MKRLLTFFTVAFACISVANAQLFVSTEPSNRNVILEEFTGRNCQYCPDGHRIANEIQDAHPGRFWAINIHAGAFATTSYPNFMTTDGTTIHNYFSIDGYPSGVVNRMSKTVSSRGQWASQTNSVLAQPSCANIAAVGFINPETRMLHLVVELYYTGNSTASSNKVSVALLQDNILGSQSGGSTNPSQWIGGQYNHMHILRDMISPVWGDQVSPTTTGSYYSLTYDYAIPENIGSPNGVDVILDDISVLVWVSQDNLNIITGNEALLFITEDQSAINPYILSLGQDNSIECSNAASVSASVMNIGSETLNSLEVYFDYNNYSIVKNIDVNIPQFSAANIQSFIPTDPEAKEVNFTITKANGEDVNLGSGTTKAFDITTFGGYEGVGEELTVKIWQDKYGNQTTWKIFNSIGEVVANGGPYSQLPGTTPRLQIATFDVPADDCYRFEIYDSNGDGINGASGAGHYQIEDAEGNIIFAENGVFKESKATDFHASINDPVMVNVNPTIEPANAGTIIGTGDYYYNSSAVLLAYPNQGFEFINWTVDGQVVETNELFVFNVEDNKNIVAVFRSLDGINSYSSDFDLFPNPVTDILTINSDNNNGIIEIFNIQGQKVVNCNYSENINVSFLNKGLYIIKITSNDGIAVKKFLKD